MCVSYASLSIAQTNSEKNIFSSPFPRNRTRTNTCAWCVESCRRGTLLRVWFRHGQEAHVNLGSSHVTRLESCLFASPQDSHNSTPADEPQILQLFSTHFPNLRVPPVQLVVQPRLGGWGISSLFPSFFQVFVRPNRFSYLIMYVQLYALFSEYVREGRVTWSCVSLCLDVMLGSRKSVPRASMDPGALSLTAHVRS